MKRRTLTNIERLQIFKIKLPKNQHSKNHDKAIISCKNIKIINMFKMDIETFRQNCRVATLSIFYNTSLKAIEQFKLD